MGRSDGAGSCKPDPLWHARSNAIPLEVVALEHVEGLVLDLPSGTAARGQFGDAVRGDRQGGHEGGVVGTLARAAEDLDGHPVDAHGIGGAAQRDLGEPAIDAGGLPAALDDGLPVLREVDAGEVLGDGLVRAGLQVRMKRPPLSWMAWTIGWQAERSSPR